MAPEDDCQLYLISEMQVLEVRPVIDWNKGKAVEFLLDSLDLANCKNVLPIYIGDDCTDEDAFKVQNSAFMQKDLCFSWTKFILWFNFQVIPF